MKELQPKPTMIQLASERANIIDLIIETGGEVTDEQIEALNLNLDGIEAKAQGYLAVIGAMEALAARAKEEADIARAFAQATERGIDAIRQRLAMAMRLADLTSVKAGGRTVSVCQGKPSVVVDNPDGLPASCLRVEIKETVTVDKEAVRGLIESGVDLKGAACLVQGPPTIRVAKPRAAKPRQIEQAEPAGQEG
jgi:hypothetical protein